MITGSAFSGPRARRTTARVSAESMPPERPTTPRSKPTLRTSSRTNPVRISVTRAQSTASAPAGAAWLNPAAVSVTFAAVQPPALGVDDVVALVAEHGVGDPGPPEGGEVEAGQEHRLVAPGRLAGPVPPGVEGPEPVAGGEIPGLVEEAIGGQVHLAVDVDDRAPRKVEGRVVEAVVVALQDAADHGVHLPGRLGEGLNLRAVEAQGGLGDQVLEKVPGERELGEDHQVRAARGGSADQLQVPGNVGAEVAEPGGHLSEADHDIAARPGHSLRGRPKRGLHHRVDSPPSTVPPTNSATRAAPPETGSRAELAGRSPST